jgi:hypothetical protein
MHLVRRLITDTIVWDDRSRVGFEENLLHKTGQPAHIILPLIAAYHFISPIQSRSLSETTIQIAQDHVHDDRLADLCSQLLSSLDSQTAMTIFEDITPGLLAGSCNTPGLLAIALSQSYPSSLRLQTLRILVTRNRLPISTVLARRLRAMAMSEMDIPLKEAALVALGWAIVSVPFAVSSCPSDPLCPAPSCSNLPALYEIRIVFSSVASLAVINGLAGMSRYSQMAIVNQTERGYPVADCSVMSISPGY